MAFLGSPAQGAAPSPATPIDLPLLAPLPLDQDETAVAFGNGVYLGVWRDSAPGMSGVQFIAAARFDASGVSMQDDPTVLYEQGSALDQPGVVFDGSRFLIYWTDPVNGQDVLGRYLDAAGTMGEVFTIGAEVGTQSQQFEAGAAAGNDLVLVAWTDARTIDTHIRASLVNGDNTFVVKDLLVSTNGANIEARSATVTWGGPNAHNFLIAWQEGNNSIRQVMAALVSETGTVTVVAPSPANPNPFPPSLSTTDAAKEPYKSQGPTSATDGQQYFVAWEDTRDPTARSAIWARTVQFDGQANTSDFQVGIGPASGGVSDYIEPQACFSDGNFLVAWLWQNVNDFRIYAGRVTASPSPTPLDGNGVEVSPLQRTQLASESRRSTLATDGNHAMLAFTQSNNPLSLSDVFLLPLDPSQPLGDQSEILLGRGHNTELGRVVASNGSVFLLVWEDTRNVTATGLDIYGMRFDRLGMPLDNAPFVLCNAAGNQFLPSAAAAPGGDFLVVWSDARVPGGDVDLYGSRVAATGAPLDGNGFKIRPGAALHGRLAPTVAAGSDGWLVAWEDWRNIFAGTLPYPEIWATTVSSAGTVSSSEVQVTSASAQNLIACAPAAAWNGQRFFVAYEQPCTQSSLMLKGDVYGNWIDSTGTRVNPVPVTIGFSAVDSQSAPALAVDPTGRVVVTWVSGGNTISAALIADNDSQLASSTVLATGAGNRDAPAVGFAAAPGSNGTFLFTWIDNNPLGVRAQRTDGQLAPLAAPFSFSGNATFLGGAPALPPANFTGSELAGSPRLSSPAAVGVTSSGSALVSENLLTPLGGRSYPRLDISPLGLQPRGAPCSDAGDCIDAVCTRGVCCDTPCNGVCQACGASGCIVTPATDSRCGSGGVISCAALSTTCRSFHDLPMNSCAAFGQCAEAGNLAECTSFDDAPDGTPCASGPCGSGSSCTAGVCACPGSPFPNGGRKLVAAPTSGCSIAGASSPTPGTALLALLLLALLVLRRKPA